MIGIVFFNIISYLLHYLYLHQVMTFHPMWPSRPANVIVQNELTGFWNRLNSSRTGQPSRTSYKRVIYM